MGGEVYLQRADGEDPAAVAGAVEALFAALPAAGRLGPHSRVLLKPNLLAKHAPGAAVTTHPALVRAVILALRARGVTDITVADSPGGAYSPAALAGVYRATGMEQVCAETGAGLYSACETLELPSPATPNRLVPSFTVLRPVAECDFIINLPKLKTHVMTYMSGAVKNLFGVVPGLQKAEFHMRFPAREHFGRMLVDLCETVQADIHIVDGMLAMEGDGPAGGSPRRLDLLVSGENPYNVDLALCRIMGLDPMHAPMLAAAAQAGLCGEALEEGLLRGDVLAGMPVPDFQAPRSYTGPVNFANKLPRALRPLLGPVARLTAPKPRVQKSACVGCGKCAEICPGRVIELRGGKAHITYRGCIRCFCCHELCPVKAIAVVRNPLWTKF